MGRINRWERICWHSSLENEEVQKEIKDCGHAMIAAWRHPEVHKKVVHIYEPDADKPFIVKMIDEQSNQEEKGLPLVDIRNNGDSWIHKLREEDESVRREEEGRYTYRKDGGSANKDLMRKYP